MDDDTEFRVEMNALPANSRFAGWWQTSTRLPAKAVRTKNYSLADADRLAGVIRSLFHRVSPRFGPAGVARLDTDDTNHILAGVHFGADIQIVDDPVRPGANH